MHQINHEGATRARYISKKIHPLQVVDYKVKIYQVTPLFITEHNEK